VSRRVGGRDRLEYPADPSDVRRKGRIRRAGQAPANDVTIDELPHAFVDHAGADFGAHVDHAGADFGAHVDHATRDKLAHRFAQQRAADAQLLCQPLLRRQRSACVA
jgi:hypothetical protein